MIEIEKKFILTTGQEKQLTKKADFLGKKIFTDIYYDDAGYSLTTNDIWLRERDGKCELKISMNDMGNDRVLDRYKELENLSDILEYFKLSNEQSFNELLIDKNFIPFCTITTTRKKYKDGQFNIDLDSTDFGYTVAEIEYMIDDESDMQQATRSIIDFAKKFDIDVTKNILGKVIEYLKVNNPNHLKMLIDAGVLR